MAKEFDIVVMGAGVVGAACAYEASLRGLKVLLLDKSDFGSETSAGSFKIIHGGLRYLQHFDIRRLKESFREQQYVRQAAPNMVKPLPFLVPCYGYGMKGRAALRIACSIYESISSKRNDGVVDELRLPNHQVLSKEEVLKIAPLISKRNLKGGVVFYDCQMLNPDRLTLQIIRSAESNGVVVRNYNEVKKIFTSQQNGLFKIEEVLVRDHKNNFDYKVKAKSYINTLGPWGNQIGKLFDDNQVVREIVTPIYSKGIQLVFPEIVGKYALSIQGKGIDSESNISRGGRSFFLQPWNGHTLVGTTDNIFKDKPENNKITLPEIKQFLKELQEAYPSEMLKPLHVKFAFGGLRTIDPSVLKKIKRGDNREGMVNTSRDEELIDHSHTVWAGLNKIENLISSIGIKYTTFRSVAEQTISLLTGKTYQGKTLVVGPSSSINRKLVSCENIPNLDELMGICMENAFKCRQSDLTKIISNYGDDSRSILSEAIIVGRSYNLAVDNALLFSKIKFACKNEYAYSLEDVVCRRLEISSLGFPGHPVIEEVSRYMAELYGWDEDRRLSEIKKLNEKFTFVS